jgi:16S rRNA (guanine(1405)-N(7))-methyltransferase
MSELLAERILRRLMDSGKYSNVYEGTLKKIISTMASRYKKEKEIEKNVRTKLHQIYGAYQVSGIWYKVSGIKFDGLNVDEVLKSHVSTAERMGFYKEFYDRIFGAIGEQGKKYKIYDAACGLNPFSVYYFKDRVELYHCSDIDVEANNEINRFFTENELVNYSSSNRDLMVDEIPFSDYDVVFLFKTLSCIERQEKGAALKILMKALAAKIVVVSFPSKSIGGKEKGMVENYSNFLEELLQDIPHTKTVLYFPTEVVFVVYKK